MSDFSLALSLILAVLGAGAFRAYVDKQVAIFYMTAFAATLLGVSLGLNEAGLFHEWVEYAFAVALFLSGTGLNIFNSHVCKLENQQR